MPTKKISKKAGRYAKTKNRAKKRKTVSNKKKTKPASAKARLSGRQGYGVAKKKVVKKSVKTAKKVTKTRHAVRKTIRKKGTVKKKKMKKPMKAAGKKIVRKSTVKKTAKKPSRKKAGKKTIRKPVTRKTVRKSKKKKAAKRKVSSRRKSSKKVLITAAEGQYFWVNNGPVLKNLQDLHKALKSISRKQFIYHVHGDNNDFALWVEYVLQDSKCANALAKVKTQKKAAKLVGAALKKHK